MEAYDSEFHESYDQHVESNGYPQMLPRAQVADQPAAGAHGNEGILSSDAQVLYGNSYGNMLSGGMPLHAVSSSLPLASRTPLAQRPSGRACGGHRAGVSQASYVSTPFKPVVRRFPLQELNVGAVLEGSSSPDEECIAVGTATGVGKKKKEFWSIEETVMLVDAKIVEAKYVINCGARGKHLVNTEKWRLVKDEMAKMGVMKPLESIINKWENVSKKYKKIVDYCDRSGRPSYENMPADMKKQYGLDMRFPTAVLHKMEEFSQYRKAINPRCRIDSLSLQDSDEEVEEVAVQEGNPAPAKASMQDVYTTGKKRKNSQVQAGMQTFMMEEGEKKRKQAEDFEAKKQARFDKSQETENKKADSIKEGLLSIGKGIDKLCDVFMMKLQESSSRVDSQISVMYNPSKLHHECIVK